MNTSPLLGLLMGGAHAPGLQVPNIPMPSAAQIGQQLQGNFAQDMGGLQQQHLATILQALQQMQKSSLASAPQPLVQPSPMGMQQPHVMPLQMMPTSYALGGKVP